MIQQYYTPSLLLLMLLLLLLTLLPDTVNGGICWAAMGRNARCTELIAERITKEECCSASQPTGASWSAEDLDPGALFFWKVLGGGVPCQSCRESCTGFQCGEGRRCAIRKGRPRCVCAPQCKGAQKPPGPVCGTDGRSYRSLCRLRKRACRRRTKDLEVDYYGHCQNSCARVKCGGGRQCLVDVDQRAHCVKCARTCPRSNPGSHAAVCGSDGVTYPSACHLRAAACRAGRSIPLAYRGPCKSGATCGSVKCRERQSCLSDIRTGSPRCVTCGGTKCARNHRRILCATNNRTYTSWCHMVRDACATGYVIETHHPGHCGSVKLYDLPNTVPHGPHEEEDEDIDTLS